MIIPLIDNCAYLHSFACFETINYFMFSDVVMEKNQDTASRPVRAESKGLANEQQRNDRVQVTNEDVFVPEDEKPNTFAEVFSDTDSSESSDW